MIIIANWKAYVEDIGKAKELFTVSKKLAKDTGNGIVLAPPAPLLGILAAKNASSVAFGAQDISATTGGAETGEITAQTYAAAGATYAIVGHSERRARGDTDTLVSEKLRHALAHGLTPVLCIGEHSRDTDGRYLSFIREELTTAISPLTPRERGKIVLAYEPLWAIGKTASEAIAADDLAEMTLYIKKVLAEIFSGKSSARIPVLYGGSVEPDNVRALAELAGIDGFLVGHASVDPRLFALLVKQLA